MKWAWDKKNTYDRAAELGIPVPDTYHPRSEEELPGLYSRLPLAIKPAIKENFFYATGAKAWRAETPKQLHDLFRRAIRQIRPEEILVQEIIPGDGQRQYSYCAFFRDGQAQSTLIAKRLRQHPTRIWTCGHLRRDLRFSGDRRALRAFPQSHRLLWPRRSGVQARSSGWTIQTVGCKRTHLGFS